MKIEISGISDIGKRRSNNEDIFGIHTGTSVENIQTAKVDDSEISFIYVCDGMGGVEGGEIASAIAKDTFGASFANSPDRFSKQNLLDAVEAANEAILEEANNNSTYKGMGCTCSAIVCQNGKWTGIHIGDSRIYSWSRGKLAQITTDQTVLERLKREGNVPKNPHVKARYSHTLEQVLGTEPELLEPQMLDGNYYDGDLFFLCSDGLYEGLKIAEIEEIINHHIGKITISELNKIIVEKSVNNSGSDNTTAVIVQAGSPQKQDYIKFVFHWLFHRIRKVAVLIRESVALFLTRKMKQIQRKFS